MAAPPVPRPKMVPAKIAPKAAPRLPANQFYVVNRSPIAPPPGNVDYTDYHNGRRIAPAGKNLLDPKLKDTNFFSDAFSKSQTWVTDQDDMPIEPTLKNVLAWNGREYIKFIGNRQIHFVRLVAGKLTARMDLLLVSPNENVIHYLENQMPSSAELAKSSTLSIPELIRVLQPEPGEEGDAMQQAQLLSQQFYNRLQDQRQVLAREILMLSIEKANVVLFNETLLTAVAESLALIKKQSMKSYELPNNELFRRLISSENDLTHFAATVGMYINYNRKGVGYSTSQGKREQDGVELATYVYMNFSSYDPDNATAVIPDNWVQEIANEFVVHNNDPDRQAPAQEIFGHA